MGVCPNCQSSVLRNVCVQHYCRDVVRPLIKRKFPQVAFVEALFSDELLFDSTVEKLGGTITHPDFWSNAQTFHMCMKTFGDFHPFVQGYVKTVMEKTTSPPLTPREMQVICYTTPQFFNRYVMCWFVTSETKVLADDGSLLRGETEGGTVHVETLGSLDISRG